MNRVMVGGGFRQGTLPSTLLCAWTLHGRGHALRFATTGKDLHAGIPTPQLSWDNWRLLPTWHC